MPTWQQWEGRVIHERFPLQQYLGGSKESAVYLTEINGSKAAIKFIPSDAADAQDRASRWESVGKLSHPHLLQILDTGRWHAEDEPEMRFAVMEYADENLAEVLPKRRLTPAEAIAMLLPTLDVLDYLHGHGMVHGNIKPANIMAAGDELKLSSDGIRHVGNSEEPTESRSIYDAPERAKGAISPSGDIWSLGIVLVESLTNRLPTREGMDGTDPKLPENIPQPFDDIARHCLSSDPGRRWSTAEIRECLGRTPTEATEEVAKQDISAVRVEQEAHAPAAEIHASALRGDTIVESRGRTGKQRGFRLAVAVIVTLVAVAASVRLFHHSSETRQPASTTPAVQSAESSLHPTTSNSLGVSKPSTGGVDHGEVTHKVIPDVPPNARNTITGTVRVIVKVAVDASGAVSHASLISRGPSEYFANQALQTARKWAFTPPTIDGRAIPSEWSLTFEFKRNGTKAVAQRTSPDF
jgi:TonB family protein